ncbi:MAG: aldehyde dehydrogenase family protein [Desulfomonilia bacterium]|jgi:acyl-CoA reductase-like NAD-dependent aldehyde dehydrogenase
MQTEVTDSGASKRGAPGAKAGKPGVTESGRIDSVKAAVEMPRAADRSISVDPATGKVIAEFPLNTKEDVVQAVKDARAAQHLWQDLPLEERIRYVRRFTAFIQENADRIAETISKDNGKTLMDAMATEVLMAAMATDFYCRKAKSFLRDRRLPLGNIVFLNKVSRIVRVPYGVVGIISPWNYPFAIPYSEVVMALLAGNTVILKTASETQAVGHILKECFESAGLPPHVFTYINMPGSKAGDAFIDAGIDKLFFTGSVSVGKYLMKKASERLTPVVLELGGNDPMIVCEDADLYRAASGAVWAGLQNAGQSCGAVERIYVQKKVYREFLSILKAKVEKLRVGNGLSLTSDVGAMTTRRQMETVQAHIADAIEKGAVINARSAAPEGLDGQFLPCIVLADVTNDMLVMKDETFGPVLAVMPYETIDEAIALANDSNLGLTASVWSKDRSKAKKIARRIMAGAVTINDHLMSHGLPETPWGGFKESGIGRTHGEIGFLEMTQPQVIVDDLLVFARRNFWWQPFDKMAYDGVRGVLDFLHGKRLPARVMGLSKMCRAWLTSFTRK